MKEKVLAVLEDIRPALHMDGGDVELVGIDEESKIVQIHLVGACNGCGMSMLTLKNGIEARMREALPEIKEVVAV